MPADLETQLTALGAHWADIVAPIALDEITGGGVGLALVEPAKRRTRARWVVGLTGAASAAVAAVVVIVTLGNGDATSNVATHPGPTATALGVDEVPVEFVGTWVAVDTDGSSLVMTIKTGDDGELVMRIVDDADAVCSGMASTMVGNGRIDSAGDLVIGVPELTCDDGSTVEAGAPLDEVLGTLTLALGRSDTLTGSDGLVWRRDGVEVPTPESATSGGMWPQSSIEEVRQAQAAVDSGDTAYDWQLIPELTSDFTDAWFEYVENPVADEIVARFLRERLGWDAYRFNPRASEDVNGIGDGVLALTFSRCRLGQTNALYPGEACAPTLDELRFETVTLDLVQPVRQEDPDGIWVVSGWRITEPFRQADPEAVANVATSGLEDWLQARVDGSGAEGYVEVSGLTELDEVPLLYGTAGGAGFERFEIERTGGPQWPDGWMDFTVRLYADDGETVVEQRLRWDGQFALAERSTTENGESLAAPYSFFEGEVTASAADPWVYTFEVDASLSLGDNFSDERFVLMTDPYPVGQGCVRQPLAADAAALAEVVRSDPDVVATAPVVVTVGGVDGLQMDITRAPGANPCENPGPGLVSQGHGGDRMTILGPGGRTRLYMIDLPESAAGRVLVIAVVAAEYRFDAVVEAAAPIIESIEFHPGGA